MLSFLAFIHQGIESVGNSLSDGRALGHSCLDQLSALGDSEQFPPRLLILLVSPPYLNSLKSEQMLSGVLQAFDEAGHGNIQLMGCSVAAVFFRRRIYREGALLVCLASRLLQARVEASPDASHDPEGAVRSVLHKLDLFTEGGGETPAVASRTLFALLPGSGGNPHLAPELHELLHKHLGVHTSIFGGVPSADDPERVRSGIVFANRKVHRNAIVAATVACGTPFGISLTQGLTDTGRALNIAEVDDRDRRVIRRFREGPAADVMRRLAETSPVPLFATLAVDRGPTVDTPKLEGETLRLATEVRKLEPLHLLIPEPEKLRRTFRDGISRSLREACVLNPIGGLGFRSTELLRHAKDVGLDLEYEIALVERDLSLRDTPYEKPFVGGFVDGEAGVNDSGRSVLGTWSNATLVFGDELRLRTPVYRSFERLASSAEAVADNDEEGINRLTKSVYEFGFPGAMLSLCSRAQVPGMIIAQSASGSRYRRILNQVRPCPVDGNDVLAVVARTRQAQFIPDSRNATCDSLAAAGKEGVISQYIMPLMGATQEVGAILQIDLGDISYDTRIYRDELDVLDALGKIVSSGLNRTFNWEESKIVGKLDRALNTCLSAATVKQGLQQYLEEALKAFGLDRGHIRIADEDRHYLSLIVGVGDYFEETRQNRHLIDFGDMSPTAQAFRDKRVVVINDPCQSDAYRDMCLRWKHEKPLYEKLQGIGSYANVPFRSDAGERGTVNLVSSKPYYFRWPHEGALKALGDRVGFLVEALRRKERESFLLGVSPQFSVIRDLNDFDKILTTEITRVAKIVGAEIASLYLWEGDLQRYILRAQHGWHRPEWINSAYHTKDDFWIGAMALAGTPRYIPDSYRYYEDEHYPTVRRYARYAFGQELSPDFTVETIALQLRIADYRLGVLTLDRRIRPGDESGFVTTDTELLQQGTDNLSGLIGVLQTFRREHQEKQELARRQEVYEAAIAGDDREPFERRVCRQTLKSYGASKVRFYGVEILDKIPQFTVHSSLQCDPPTTHANESAISPDEEALVTMTIEANRLNEKRIFTERVMLKDTEWEDPKRVAVADLVKRACVPLLGSKRLVGVLDLQWSSHHRQPGLKDHRHLERLLPLLGEVVGSAYRRTQADIMHQRVEMKLQRSERRNVLAVQTTSAYVLQHHHELRTIVQKMAASLGSLEDAIAGGAEREREQAIQRLSRQIRAGSEALSRMIDIGSKVTYPAYEKIGLKGLVDSALMSKRARCEEHRISVEPVDIPGNLSVHVDPVLIDVVLGNLLDNAIEAMENREQRVLSVSATANAYDETATTAIRDTGVGMTEEKHERITKGFFSDNGRISVGVPIASLILAIHGGTISYVSAQGRGTEVLITLPLRHSE
jgi:signal transduction histidine kinase/GAF domain-containing protein